MLGGNEFHDKLMGFFWLVALAMRSFGEVEWAARVPSAVAACLGVAATAWWGRAMFGPLTGMLAAIILATAGQYAPLARLVMIDMAFTWWLSAAFLWGGWWAIAGRHAGRPIWPFYFFLSLAVLTKGPVALVLAVLVFAPFLYLTRPITFGELRIAPGVVLIAAVAGSWYVAATLIAPGFMKDFLWTHHVVRFTSGVGHETNVLAFFYLLPAAFSPWSLYLPLTGVQAYRAVRRRSPAVVFCTLWTVVIFVFFSLSRSKLTSYVLPLFPPLALLTAEALARAVRGEALPRWERVVHRVAFAAVAGAIVLAPIAAYPVLAWTYPAWAPYALLPLICAPLLLPGPRWLRAGRHDCVLGTVAAITTLLLAGFYCIAGPVLFDEHSLRSAARALARSPAHEDLVALHTKAQSLMFYTGDPVHVTDDAAEAAALLGRNRATALVARQEAVGDLQCYLQRPVYVWWHGGRKGTRLLIANRPSSSTGAPEILGPASDACPGLHS
jgi:4-amino-4-deoxy-L-arabinose transferase-like glycosyltransferase